MAWLDQGLQLLAEQGASALRIDRLAARMGLSKGSFYHHFAGITGYKLDLLDHYERRYTTRYIDTIAREAPPTATARLQRLETLVVEDRTAAPGLDIAIRAWATQDDDAFATVKRIDRTRLAYLNGLFEEIVGPGEEAKLLSQHRYLLILGARQIIPPLGRADLRRLYAWLGKTDRPRSDRRG